MAYTILTVVFLAVAALFVLLALKALVNRYWILGWLRGMFGILLLMCSVGVVVAALDISSYKEAALENAIATISFQQDSEQHFNATLVEPNGKEHLYILAGDLWQIDARIIKWEKPIMGLGVKPGYRLGRLSGRYYSLEQERNAERTVFDIYQTEYGIDIWNWLRDNSAVPVVDAIYGSASFLPMSDGALFIINLTSTGLIARPLNEPAQRAVSNWQ